MIFRDHPSPLIVNTIVLDLYCFTSIFENPELVVDQIIYQILTQKLAVCFSVTLKQTGNFWVKI